MGIKKVNWQQVVQCENYWGGSATVNILRMPPPPFTQQDTVRIRIRFRIMVMWGHTYTDKSILWGPQLFIHPTQLLAILEYRFFLCMYVCFHITIGGFGVWWYNRMLHWDTSEEFTHTDLFRFSHKTIDHFN